MVRIFNKFLFKNVQLTSSSSQRTFATLNYLLIVCSPRQVSGWVKDDLWLHANLKSSRSACLILVLNLTFSVFPKHSASSSTNWKAVRVWLYSQFSNFHGGMHNFNELSFHKSSPGYMFWRPYIFYLFLEMLC